jgi:release factor glutamine methyltransferase
MPQRSASSQGKPSAPGKPELWTTRKLLQWMSEHFKAKDIDSPRVVAEMLLSHVLGCERMRLYMDADRPASASELSTLRDLVARAAKHEPVQYLVGHAWFFSRQYKVDRSTLIPRSCTETLVEHVLQWLRLNPGHASPLAADVGTGSGCIGISIAAQVADAHVIASDVVPEALDLARANAATHKVADRMEFVKGAGIAAIVNARPGAWFDVITSNPPYIPDNEWDKDVAKNVKDFEPASALRGGTDGLDVIRPLIAEAPAILKPGGLLTIEIANAQKDAVIELAEATGALENPQVLKDHEGLWRVLAATRRA